MKKILIIIILTLFSINVSYSKDNPLKIFKKEILGEEAERMKQEIDSDRKIFEKKIRRGENQGLAYLIDPKEKY